LKRFWKHLHRAQIGVTDRAALALLYEGLMQQAPSIGAGVGRAIAVGHSQSAGAGLAALHVIDAAVRETYQLAWAARAHLLTMAGQALQALDRAITLAPGSRVRSELARLRAALVAQIDPSKATDLLR
jgi:predicted RNA polymerase sigma factor